MCCKKMKKTLLTLSILGLFLTSCDKVSPIGILVAGTAVEYRVKMSELFYRNH